MKNLKRVLALVMTVALVFSLSVSALAFTDSASVTHEQAVNVLSELNVIKGYPDGSFRPSDSVTRAEMAKMITVILNKGVDDPTQFESGTTDLTDISWNWGKSYITYCYLLNIIAGYGDGTFRPDNDVTVQEAAKMILVALGFDVTQEGLEGVNWAVNANARANQYDIYLGVTQGVNEAATRDSIAQMLYNMLKANTVHYDVNIYTGISTLIKDEIALSKYFNCEMLNGMVVANEYASLWDGTPLMAGRTEILYFNDDAIENGIFDIAKGNFRYDELVSWVTDTLNVSTGKDELGLWVTVIRNQTTKKIVGGVMLNDHLMTVVEGGNGNFLDAIKAAGLRLVDGRYTVIVNGQVFKWETAAAKNSSSYWLPTFAQHPLAIYSETGAGELTSRRSHAYLYQTLSNLFGTEFKDMNGMTFRAVELNGDNYVDVIYVETDTLTQVTKVETKGGAKEYTFANLNLGYDSGDPYVITNYSPKSVKAADIETSDTLAVDDYVLVAQVNETYYVSKVVFEDLTVSVKSTADKSLTLKDKDNASTTYKLSNIPVVNAIAGDDEIYTNVKNAKAELLGNLVVGNKYTFGFDAAGNVVMATEGEKKTDYGLLNGMATTFGTSYTAQLFLEDSTTVTGGLGDFVLRLIRPAAASTYTFDGRGRGTRPAEYLASASDSASDAPLLVSYKANGSKYDITVEVDLYNKNATSHINTYSGGKTMTINNNSYNITSNTVFYYRIQNGNKVNYYAYTDYTKAPTFTQYVKGSTTVLNSVTVSAALVEGSNTYLAAVFVQADKADVTDATGKDYIYLTKLNKNDYDNKTTYFDGLTIDENGNVKFVSAMAFDDDYNNNKLGILYTYTKSSTADVYKLGEAEDLYTARDVSGSYLYYGIGSTGGTTSVVTYSSSKSNLYQAIDGGDKYEGLTGSNFEKAGLKKGDTVYLVTLADSTVTPFVMRKSTTGTVTPPDPDAGLISFNPITTGTTSRVSVDQDTMELSVITFAGNAGNITVPVSSLNLASGYRVGVTNNPTGGTWTYLASSDSLTVYANGTPTNYFVGVFDSNYERVAMYTINAPTFVGLSAATGISGTDSTASRAVTGTLSTGASQTETLTLVAAGATGDIKTVVLTTIVPSGASVSWTTNSTWASANAANSISITGPVSGAYTIAFDTAYGLTTSAVTIGTLKVTSNGVEMTYIVTVESAT